MISATQRRRILAFLNEHGRDVPMKSVEDASPTKLIVADGVLYGPPHLIAAAMDIRDNVLVPHKYDEEASTWA